MTGFAMAIVRRRSDVESEQWIRDVMDGTPADRQRALAKLQERASQTNAADDWNELGIALHHAGRHGEARQVFEGLVEQEPDEATFRLNLAASLSQRQEIDLVRYHLRQVIAHADDEDTREFAEKQLEGYESFVGATENAQRFRTLQIAALEEQIGHEDATAEDFVALARIYLQQVNRSGDEMLLTRAAGVLEKGHARFPNDVAILEHLVACYVRSDPDGRMAEVSLALEKLAPDSPILATLNDVSEEEAESFADDMQARVWSLLGAVIEGKPDERDAALNELRRIVASLPQNPWYRCTYAMALAFTGRNEQALQEAEKLINIRSESHSFHFNLAQVLWSVGRKEDARLHIQLAEDLATVEERADVATIRAEWEKHP